jgi:hypothetical protein
MVYSSIVQRLIKNIGRLKLIFLLKADKGTSETLAPAREVNNREPLNRELNNLYNY